MLALQHEVGSTFDATPGAALAAWLHRFFAFTTSKRHIAAELLKQTGRNDPLFENSQHAKGLRDAG